MQSDQSCTCHQYHIIGNCMMWFKKCIYLVGICKLAIPFLPGNADPDKRNEKHITIQDESFTLQNYTKFSAIIQSGIVNSQELYLTYFNIRRSKLLYSCDDSHEEEIKFYSCLPVRSSVCPLIAPAVFHHQLLTQF